MSASREGFKPKGKTNAGGNPVSAGARRAKAAKAKKDSEEYRLNERDRKREEGRAAAREEIAAGAASVPLHQQLLDAILNEFKDDIPAIAKKISKKAAGDGGEGITRFVIEFVAKYADRSDENEASAMLRQLTRTLSEGQDFMPSAMYEEMRQNGAKSGDEGGTPDDDVAAERLLESAEESRIIESDLGAAPVSVVPSDDPPGEGL